jgi:hypothetical protein
MNGARTAFDRSGLNAIAGVRQAAFWGSVGLPAVYLPLLYAGSGETQFAGLGVGLVHAACLAVGHEYVPGTQ